jgi:formyl-CoA transferase/CoA:oxalate CoA-transferase
VAPRERSGPLAGVRVVDLTQTLAGPYCTMLLADLGADVVKVESRARPDRARSVPTTEVGGETVYFASLNRNKRSVELDLKDEDQRDALLGLVAGADVVVENFAPGVTARLGIEFDDLRVVNPRIVMCSITGFGAGATGPAYDYLVQALVGTMSLTGEPDGPPTKYGVSVVDHVGGAFGAIGILAALRDAERTGEGRHVDISLFDTHLSMLSYIAADFLNGGALPERQAWSAHPYAVPSQLFETADGHVVVMPLADHMWPRLCEALGLEELGGDPALASSRGRLEQRERVVTGVAAAIAALRTADALEQLARHEVPAAPVRSVAEALADPRVAERDMVVEAGGVRMLGNPVRVSGHDQGPFAPAPTLGEHTDEVLREAAAQPPARSRRSRSVASRSSASVPGSTTTP